MDDFTELIDTAHANDIKIVIDFAPNHTSTAEYGEMVFPEDGKIYRNGTLISGFSTDTQNIFNHESWTDFSTWENSIYHSMYGLADLNQMNGTVDDYLKDSIDMWLDLGVDGIRVDAVKHMPMGSIISFKYGLKEYLEELYPVFAEILSVDVRPTFFELLAELTEKSKRVYNIAMMTKFISAIKIKKLRQGSRVDRYISKIIYRSVYLERLIKPYKGHYLLANSNTESLDYKLALLSCFMFCTSENEKLFELKIKRWEERKSLLTNER